MFSFDFWATKFRQIVFSFTFIYSLDLKEEKQAGNSRTIKGARNI
jgi:hypothetical protein